VVETKADDSDLDELIDAELVDAMEWVQLIQAEKK